MNHYRVLFCQVGFQCVPLTILVLGGINSGVFPGGSMVSVSVIVLQWSQGLVVLLTVRYDRQLPIKEL